jgi:1,4-dihydroxy-2-naphthoate octaprenyltransferase
MGMEKVKIWLAGAWIEDFEEDHASGIITVPVRIGYKRMLSDG